MNLHYQRFFLQSGLITFLLMGVIFSFLLSGILDAKKSEPFAMTKSDVISVSLEETASAPSEPTHASAPIQQPTADTPAVSKPIEKTPPSSKAPKEDVPEIDDLFATVKVSKAKKKPVDNTKQLTELNALEETVLNSKRDSKLFEKVKSLELAKSGVKLVATSSGPVVNEYNAKIQAIIYTNFHPASGTEGFAARVRVTISPEGKLLAYKVISYSANAVFNAEVDWLKERLRKVALPTHPHGSEAVFEIILTAKE